MGKELVVHIYNRILFGHKRGRNGAICDNVDGTWGHYVKWNKSDRERQIPYNLIYIRNLKPKPKPKKSTELTDKENRLVVARGKEVRGEGNGGRGLKGTNVQLYDK